MTTLTFRPKKSLGQNFLVDENIARKIIRVVDPHPNDLIVEIGPGFGVLTKYLLQVATKVVAVEIDRNLAAELQDRFGHYPNFHLVKADFLRTDLQDFVEGSTKMRVVGNIPYHITSQVIFKVFDCRTLVHDMTLMLQREVAQRIVSPPNSKDYGILSVFSQLFSKPRIAFQVSRNVFKPRPDVDSSIVQWDFSAAKPARPENAELLRKLIHTLFQKRRKMLRTALKSDPTFAPCVPKLNFDLQKRPEDLAPEEFVELANQLSLNGEN